jgi:hypothetical protein
LIFETTGVEPVQRIRATITYPLSGSAGVITLYTKTTGPENSASATLCATRLQNALAAGKSMFSTTTVFTSDAFVDTIDPATGVITGTDTITPWTVAGDQGPGYLPPATQLCTTWKTDDVVAGHRVRGRTFWGPLAVGDLDSDGSPAAAKLSHQSAAEAAWVDSGATAVYTCVWHRPRGGSGGSDHEITGYSHKDKFAVLRSRRD